MTSSLSTSKSSLIADVDAVDQSGLCLLACCLLLACLLSFCQSFLHPLGLQGPFHRFVRPSSHC